MSTKSDKTENLVNVCEKRSQFGTRFLGDESQVYDYNAWDDIQWDLTMKEAADLKIAENSKNKVPDDRRKVLENDAVTFWDKFYDKHENKFFKDRHWLFTVFPELNVLTDDSIDSNNCDDSNGANRKVNILEIGCGAGNTVFPLLEMNTNPNLFVFCCDFSPSAISIVKEDPHYDESRCKAFVLDITDDNWNVPFPESSIDIVTIIFVLSAIDPNRMQHVIDSVVKYLKPNGLILFRDYGLYDLTQLRFKNGQCIHENFYVRGDGTRVYYFTEEKVHEMMTKAGLTKQLLRVDRRLQVNRAKHVKMYRVWVFGKYCKTQ